jgi:uncharacterized protein YgiM (DUF1202 family)
MHSHLSLTLLAYGAALVATLIVAAWATPRAWWRRPNARALAVLAAGTFGIGAALLWMLERPNVAHAANLPVAAPTLAANYRAWDDLNLRDGTGVSSRRVAVVPAGARVTATGERRGDWWLVSARVDGVERRGWVSSLWLRRPEEAR